MEKSSRWRCVLVCWGEKYGAADINHLVQAVRDKTSNQPDFLLLTDRSRSGLVDGVESREIPPFWLRPEFRRGGCLTKLAMFEKGVIPEDLPVVYIDLDTIILGDMSEAIGLLSSSETIFMLPSSVLPFGKISRLISCLSGGRLHARGNSSILVFHPARTHFLAETFRANSTAFPSGGHRPMLADDRYISWVAQHRVKAIPDWFAVKLPSEFMRPMLWWVYLRSALPWVKRRRSKLRAVTLPGSSVKSETLLSLPDGALIIDRRGRKITWTDRALAPIRARLIDDAKALNARRARADKSATGP